MVEKMSELGQTSRTSSALLKRQEAIKRWKLSDTNRESTHRSPEDIRITFDKETVFLFAVSNGDVEETRNLINQGLDINCSNVDGLTGLHQACIDENGEMVELLVEAGAILDARDDEGWTPLHAAASAGNVQIAQILTESGANLLAVNNEGEIPVDLAEEEEMEEFLEEEMEKLGVEIDEVRNIEEKMMTEDAMSWINSKRVDEKFNFQGASALHVAAAKGYHDVMKLLLQAGCDVNMKDKDGWSPLHAAVHWAQQQVAEILTEAGADFSIRNNIGQTPVDVAQGDMIRTVEELRKKAKVLAESGFEKPNRIISQRGSSHLKNDINDNDQFVLSGGHNQYAEPVKSALKGGREKHKNKGKAAPAEDQESESESSGESENSDSDTENKPQQNAKPAPSGPLRPSSLARPSSTATNEKVSTPRNPLMSSTPLRPSALMNRDNDKKEDNKTDSVSSRISNRLKQREGNADRSSGEPIRFNIPRPGVKFEEKEFSIPRPSGKSEEKEFSIHRPGGKAESISMNVPRPGRTDDLIQRPGRTDDSRKEDSRIKFNIPRPDRPQRNEEKEDSKQDDYKSRRLNRVIRGEEKEEEGKQQMSKADEIRAKFNIPKPGDHSMASAALNRFREKRNEPDDEGRQSKLNRDDDGSKTEDSISSIRARKGLLIGPPRPGRQTDDRMDSDTRKAIKNRLELDKEDRGETISIRKKQADREKEKEAEKRDEKKEEDNDDDDDSLNFSAQRARRKRQPREKRKSTGVAFMPDEDEDENEDQKDTKYNTRTNEDSGNKKADSLSVEEEPPRLSLAERLRRSRENREGTSSSGVSTSLSSRSRDITPSSSRSSSADSSEPRELQRRLRDAINEIEEYKTKLERANKEKDELQDKLTQCEDAMKKMKDENGALIRVISTLTRSNAS